MLCASPCAGWRSIKWSRVCCSWVTAFLCVSKALQEHWGEVACPAAARGAVHGLQQVLPAGVAQSSQQEGEILSVPKLQLLRMVYLPPARNGSCRKQLKSSGARGQRKSQLLAEGNAAWEHVSLSRRLSLCGWIVFRNSSCSLWPLFWVLHPCVCVCYIPFSPASRVYGAKPQPFSLVSLCQSRAGLADWKSNQLWLSS